MGDGSKYYKDVCEGTAQENICLSCQYQDNCQHRKPEIEMGNAAVWGLLNFSAGTWLMGFNEPYAVNFSHIREVAGLLDIELDRTILQKIRIYERAFLEMKAEKNG